MVTVVNMDVALKTYLLGIAAAICCVTVSKVVKIRKKRMNSNANTRWKNRKWWTKPWILRRDLGLSVHSMVHGELRFEDPNCFKNFIRMNSEIYDHLLSLIKNDISKRDTHLRTCISANKRLSVTLRYLATGESFRSLSYSYRIPPSTISTIIPEVCQAICNNLMKDYLKMPDTEEMWQIEANKFYEMWNFPNCIGAMDGKHIIFQPLRTYGSYFRNYKNTDSIILLAIVSADYRFLFIDVGVNGRVSDGGVFRNSQIYDIIDKNTHEIPPPAKLPGSEIVAPYVLVADDAFQLQENVMKPFANRSCTTENTIFNYRLSRARRCVENAFGILANRFRVFLGRINLSPEKVTLITKTACVLHNYLIIQNPEYSVGVDNENTTSVTFTPGDWRKDKDLLSLSLAGSRHSSRHALSVRENFKQYFNTGGFVPWDAVKNFRF